MNDRGECVSDSPQLLVRRSSAFQNQRKQVWSPVPGKSPWNPPLGTAACFGSSVWHIAQVTHHHTNMYTHTHWWRAEQQGEQRSSSNTGNRAKGIMSVCERLTPLKVTCCKWHSFDISSLWFMSFYCTGDKLRSACSMGCSVREVRTRCGRKGQKKGTQERERECEMAVGEEERRTDLALCLSAVLDFLPTLFQRDFTFSHRENETCTNQLFASLVVLFGRGGGRGDVLLTLPSVT